jgi:signal transduction histidine kinase
MLQLPFAVIELDSVPGDERRVAFPLRYGSRTGSLIVPADLPEPILRRLRERVVPPLGTLLGTASEREAMGDSLRELATEQANLRRVAVLVARGVPPSDVVAAVAAEAASLLEADATRLMRYETAGTATVIAEYSKPGIQPLLGRRLAVDGGVTELVLRTSRPARVDSYDHRRGPLAELARSESFGSSVGAPIVVEGRVWGALVVLWSRREPPPPRMEERLAQFTELVATAVANTESREKLNASRARIVLAADDARRSFERDLHDGVQQRLVSLGLELRAAEALVPGELDELKTRLTRTAEGLANTFKDVQEISRGLHPAMLSQGGLMSALKTLARRCPVPVTINPDPSGGCPAASRWPRTTSCPKRSRTPPSTHMPPRSTSTRTSPSTARPNGRSSRCRSATTVPGAPTPALGTGLTGLTDRVVALGDTCRSQVQQVVGRR